MITKEEVTVLWNNTLENIKVLSRELVKHANAINKNFDIIEEIFPDNTFNEGSINIFRGASNLVFEIFFNWEYYVKIHLNLIDKENPKIDISFIGEFIIDTPSIEECYNSTVKTTILKTGIGSIYNINIVNKDTDKVVFSNISVYDLIKVHNRFRDMANNTKYYFLTPLEEIVNTYNHYHK